MIILSPYDLLIFNFEDLTPHSRDIYINVDTFFVRSCCCFFLKIIERLNSRFGFVPPGLWHPAHPV